MFQRLALAGVTRAVQVGQYLAPLTTRVLPAVRTFVVGVGRFIFKTAVVTATVELALATAGTIRTTFAQHGPRVQVLESPRRFTTKVIGAVRYLGSVAALGVADALDLLGLVGVGGSLVLYFIWSYLVGALTVAVTRMLNSGQPVEVRDARTRTAFKVVVWPFEKLTDLLIACTFTLAEKISRVKALSRPQALDQALDELLEHPGVVTETISEQVREPVFDTDYEPAETQPVSANGATPAPPVARPDEITVQLNMDQIAANPKAAGQEIYRQVHDQAPSAVLPYRDQLRRQLRKEGVSGSTAALVMSGYDRPTLAQVND